jgi:hypothetical protein
MRGADRLNVTEIKNQAIVFLLCAGAWAIGAGAALGAGVWWLALSTVVFGPFAAILAHELGHALAAWAVGWRVWIVHAAPFAWRLRPLSLRLVGDYGGPDVGGFVLATPRLPEHDTKWRDAAIGAGGPLASWTLGLALIGLTATGPLERLSGEDWRHVLYALGMFSIAAAIGTSLPLVKDGRGNDAACVQARLDGTLKPLPHAEWAFAIWAYGVEPKHWDEGLRASVEAARCNPALAHVPAYFDFAAAVRAGHPASARAALAAMGANRDEEEINVLEGYVRAALESDGRTAQELIARAPPTPETEAEVAGLRELALVEIERLGGELRAARKRLARLHASLAKQQIGKQPHWGDLIGAARARLAA